MSAIKVKLKRATWEKAIQDTVDKHMDSDDFDGSAELPKWPNKKINEDFKGE